MSSWSLIPFPRAVALLAAVAVVVGALFKDNPDPARTFVAEQGATWPMVTDPERSIGTAWKVLGPPQTFLVDRDGIIREVQVGRVRDAAELDRLLAAILP